jgi:hypothetical protein
MLSVYRNHAELIVTTLLHCALPAPGYDYSCADGLALQFSGRQGFRSSAISSLLNLLTVHSPEELAALDWNPAVVDCVAEKLPAINSFTMATRRWQLPLVPLNWSLAPSILLQPS